jgi:hypothetical protein
MDLSVVAAVGSFVVSERVLRPKATLLILLGGVLAYDLSTKTQDAASLRIYRGTMHQDVLEDTVYGCRSNRNNFQRECALLCLFSLASVSGTN